MADATLETWCSILEALAKEAKQKLEVDGVAAVLDNAETLTKDKLAGLLMAYRDTLFATKGVWWIVIGQSGLYSHIDALDSRVSQRISGKGVEIPPFKATEFHELIEKRVHAFRNREDVPSPLATAIHGKLFDASCGEVRFVLDTANTLVSEVIAQVRFGAAASIGAGQGSPSYTQKVLDQALKRHLIDSRIPDKLALDVLRGMCVKSFRQQKLSDEALLVLRQLVSGSGKVTPKESAAYGFHWHPTGDKSGA